MNIIRIHPALVEGRLPMHSQRDIDLYSIRNIIFLLVDTATVAMPSFEEVLEQLAEIHDLEVARPWVSLDAMVMMYSSFLPHGCV